MAEIKVTLELIHDTEDTGWFVHVKECPGCMSQGDTFWEACDMIQEALEMWLEITREDRDPMPEGFGTVLRLLQAEPTRAELEDMAS